MSTSGLGLRGSFRRGNIAIAVILLVAVVLVAMVVAMVAIKGIRKPIARLPPRAPETAEAKFQSAASAFNAAPADPNDPEVKAIGDAFTALQKSLQARDLKSLRELFDAERMYQEAMRSSNTPTISRKEEREFVAGLQQGFASGLLQNVDLWNFSEFEMRQCRFSADRSEVMVFVRIGDGEDRQKFRWWLINRDGRWVFYDFEDLSTGLRSSSSIGGVMSMARVNPTRILQYKQQVDQIGSASRSLIAGDLDAAESAIQQIDMTMLPADHQALVQLLTSTLRLGRLQYKEALEACDLAQQLQPDMVLANFTRAMAHNGLGDYEAARVAAERYLNLLGSDADGFEQLGIALAGLGRHEEAIAAYRKGLDDDPNSLDNLYQLALALPAEKKSEVGERFAKMKRTAEQFDYLYESLRWSDPEALREIAKQYALVAPGNTKIALLEARDLFVKEQYEAAAQRAMAALTGADEFVRGELLGQYCAAMIQLDRMLDAYRELEQTDEAFGMLASRIPQEGGNFDRLRELIAAHQQRSPNDPWLHYYRGIVAIHDKNTEEGLKQFRSALDLAQDEQTKSTMRYRLVSEMAEAGKSLEAYEQLEPKNEVFSQLATSAFYNEQPELLQSLIEALRKREPNSTALPGWEMNLAYLKQDYAATIDIIRRQSDAIRAAEDNNSYSTDDRLIRSLVHLKRFDEAEQEIAKFMPEGSDPTWFRTLVYAAKGDVAQTAANFKKLTEDGWESGEFYYDDILGPALRSEAFKSLREQYPDPEAEDNAKPMEVKTPVDNLQ